MKFRFEHGWREIEPHTDAPDGWQWMWFENRVDEEFEDLIGVVARKRIEGRGAWQTEALLSRALLSDSEALAATLEGTVPATGPD